MAHKKHTHYIVSQIERARIATFVLWQDVTLNLELFASLRLHLAMHLSLTVCKASDLLSNREPLLLTDYATRFIYGGRKRHLMMLSQGSYEVYQQTMSYLELTLVRLELSSNLLVPYAFSSQVLVSLLSPRVISWQGRKS